MMILAFCGITCCYIVGIFFLFFSCINLVFFATVLHFTVIFMFIDFFFYYHFYHNHLIMWVEIIFVRII